MTDEATPSTPPTPPPASPPAQSKRRWGRRIRTLIVGLLFLGVLSRIVVSIAFPTVLKRVASYYGLDCSYDRLELSMLSGDAGLWHLTLTPKGGGEPIFNSEYVFGDVSILNLLRGKLAVWRVEADGVEVLVDRNADGSIPVLKLIATKASTAAATPAPVTAASQPSKAIDLSAPLRIDALRLTHIKAHIRDKSVAPPLDATFTMNLRLSNLGLANTPVHFAVDMDADPILDAMHVEGDGHGDEKSVDAKLVASVDGLRLHPLEPYLHALGILPAANEISLKASGSLKLAPAAGNFGALAGSLNLEGLSAIADGEEAAGLDHLAITADSIDLHSIKLAALSIDNARLSGRRSTNGRIRFGGVEFVGMPPSTAPAAPPSTTPFVLPVASLAAFDLKHLHAGFHDDGIAPPVALAIDMDDVSAKNIVFDPKQPDASVQLSGSLRAPGFLEKASFKGSVTPFAIQKKLEMSLQASGIAPTALEPYLNALGITSQLHHASFACDLSADVSLPPGIIAADAKLKNVKLSDPADLLALDHVNITGASYRLSPPLIRLKDIEVVGPALSIRHEASGSFAAVGFATKSRTASTVATVSAETPLATTQPLANQVLPSLQIDHFAWTGIDIHYADQSLNPPAATELSDAGVSLDNIFFDLSDSPTTQPISPGTIHAMAKIPNLIDSFTVDGKVTPAPAEIVCDLNIVGSGLTAKIAEPYLKSIGIEPTLHDGKFNAAIKADVSRNGISLDAEQIRFADGDQELAGVDAFKIGNTSLKNNLLNIGAIEVDRPRIDITHESNGAFSLVGFRLSPALFNPHQKPVAAVTMAKPTTSPTTAPAFALPIGIALNGLSVNDATLKWTDRAAKPEVQTSAVAGLTIAPLTLGQSAAPTQLHGKARVEGSIDSATADGTFTPSFDAPAVSLNLSVQGLRAGPLASYLPPGITVPLRNGQFHTAIEAGVTSNPQGGIGAKFIVTDLDYRDQGTTQPLLKVDSFRAIASRIDPAQKFYAIDELSSAGVETSARRTADGGVGLLGVELKAVPAKAPSTQVAVPEMPPTTSTAAPSDVAALVAQARQRGIAISLKTLDLHLKRLALSDDVRPSAAPLVVSDLHFRNQAPVDWNGRISDSVPPTPFRLDCTLDPLIGAVTATAQVAPLANAPTVAIDLTAADIRGDGLTSLIPELKPYVDGSSLENGQFHAHLETMLRVDRHGAWNFDVSRGLSADVDVKAIAFRATPNGPILLGLDGIHSDAIHIAPAAGELHVKTLEITKPIGRIVREDDGIHLAGLVIKIPQLRAMATTLPTTQKTAEPAVEPMSQPVVAAAAPPPHKPSGEIRLDQLLINDIDFVAEDQTMTPALVFPLTSLDVEVRDFSNLAPYEDKPIRFNVLVNAGKVPIPSKLESVPSKESRELFAQASASGMIGLYPTSHGWIKTSLSGLELAGLRGAAKEAGVTLTGGVFDSTADARLPGDGTIRTTSKFTFTDLSLSEPPNGPIFRFLHLPAPLDVVIGALQDQEGSITVPIDVPVNPGDLSVSQLVGPAVGAFSSIVVTAIASAPLKAAGGLTDMLGMGGTKKHAPEPPVVLNFEPGYTGLNSSDQSQLTLLAQRMVKDKSLNLVIHHDLGGGDLTVANERANPSAQDAQNLAEQLRQQQMLALQKRSTLAGTARAELAWGSAQAADSTIEQLRALDKQVAENDDALDRLFGLLRPGADRQAARRTRGACLEYGRDRLDAVKQALESAGLTDMDRVHIANPQFAQVPGDDGGKIVVTLVPKKKG